MNGVLNIQVRVAARQANAALAQVQGQVAGLGKAGGAAATGGMAMFNQALNPTHLSRFGKNLQWTGRQLQMSFTLPILLAGAAATKFALDNNRAITQVQKVYGTLGDTAHDLDGELKALETTFRLLSNQYGVHQNEVIDMAARWAEAGSAGVGLAKSVQTTMQAMILGGMDAEKATEGLIAIQAAFALSSSHLRDVLYDLNVVENDTGISLSGLIDVMARAGGVARTAGIQIEELAGLAASIVPAAGSAAQAGNALRTIISRIMAPTKEAGELMAQMGIDIFSAGWQSQDAMGRIKTLAGAFNDLSDSQQTVVTTAIASRWQLNRADILFREIESSTGFYAATLKALNGEIDTQTQSLAELDKFLGSDARQWTILTNSIRNALTAAIQPALPAMFAILQRISALSVAFGNLSPEMKQWIILGLAMLAVVGPLARILGGFSLLFGTLGTATKLMTKFLFGNIIAWTSYSTAVNAAGVSTVVASKRFALAGGVLSKALMVLWDLVGFSYSLMVVKPADAILASARLVAGAVGSLWAATVGVAQTAALRIMYVWDAVVAAGRAAAFGVAYAWSVIWPAVVGAATTAMTAIQLGFLWLQANWLTMLRTMPLLATTVWTGMAHALLATQVSLSMGMTAAWAAMSEAVAMITIGLQSYMQLAIWKIQGMWAAGTAAITRFWFIANTQILAGMVQFSSLMSRAWVMMQVVAVNSIAAIRAAFVTFVTGFPALVRTLPLFWTTAMMAMSRAWLAMQVFVMQGSRAMMIGVRAAVLGGLKGILASIVGFMTTTVAVVGLPLWAVVGIVIAVIAVIAAIIENFYDDGIRGFIMDIRDGLFALPEIFARAFEGVIRVLGRAIEVIGEQLSYLNPFARHSPSLVDNVTNGISVILGEYARLRGIPAIMNSATRALKEFNAATNPARASMNAKEQAETRAEIVAISPNAGPAVDAMFRSLNELRPALVDIGEEMAAQEAVVAEWKYQLDQANLALDAQERILDRLQDTARQNKDALDEAKRVLDDLMDTPIEGMGEYSDAIFENEMAQKRLRLEMLKLGEAGQSFEDIQAQIAALQGDIETLRGEATELRLAGAGSDVTGPIEDQIRLMEEAQRTLAGSSGAGGLAEIEKQLEELKRQGEILELEESLAFDPLKRQIDAASESMAEMPFDELMAQIKAQKDEVARLTEVWEMSDLAVANQQAQVDQAKATRDGLATIYDEENNKLGLLKDAYQAVEDQIRAMEQALSDFQSKASSSTELSNAQMLFDAAAGFDFEDVGGTGGIGREGELIDIEAFNKDLEKMMQDSMKGLGEMDLFKPIKDAFKGVWEWIKRNAKNIIIGAAVVIGFLILEALFLPLAVVVEVAALLLYALFGPEVFKAIWKSLKEVMGSIWAVIQDLWDPIGEVFMDIFSAIGVATVWLWDEILYPLLKGIAWLFTDLLLPVLEVVGEVFIAIFKAIGAIVAWAWNTILYPLLKALWNFFTTYVIPVLELLGAVAEIIFVMIGRLATWLWDEILRPVFEAIGWVITNALVPIIQLLGAIVAVVFGAIAWFVTDVLGPVFTWLWKEIVAPVFEGIGAIISWIWNATIKPAFDAIAWTIQNVVAPVFFWLLDNVISPVFGAIGRVVSGVWDGIVAGFRGTMNLIIRAFNAVARGVKAAADFLHIDVKITEIPEIGGGGGSTGGGGGGAPRVMHDGGFVTGPFGVNGLRSDETYKILQRGEYVIDKGTVAAMNRSATSGPTLANGAGGTNNEYHFHGDLSFPNIQSPDDAKTFLRNLESLVE